MGFTWLALALLTCGCLPATCLAGTVTITMPDNQIRYAIQEVCTWYHCWKDGATYASDEALAQEVADRLVRLVSVGHYASLEDVGGTLTIIYDQVPK